MFRIKMTPDPGPQLQAGSRHTKFASALALTAVARTGQGEVRSEMPRVFDRPTPYAMNSLRVIAAKRDKLESAVYLKDDGFTPAHLFMDPEIEGGPRRIKRFERALGSRSGMPKDLYAIPGMAARRDAFGNVPTGQIRQVLSYFKAAQLTAGYESNLSDKRRDSLHRGSRKRRGTGYFVASKDSKKTKHLRPGIYQWTAFGFGRAIKPLFIFGSKPTYRERLQLQGIVDRVVQRDLGTEFEKAMAYALRTAK